MAEDNLSQETLKKKMMVSILKFLHEELTSGVYDAENSEGLEVAIQCLESIYKVNCNSLEEPPISSVYKSYLRTNVLLQPDPTEESKLEAENLKTLGNNAMNKQQFTEAITFYTRALQLNPKNAIYYCNRAAAFSRINNHRAAIRDCETAIEIDASYSKAYGRLGIAYSGLENYKLAIEHYERALTLDPKNESYLGNLQQAQKKLAEQQNAKSSSSSGPSCAFSGRDLDSILESPQLMTFATQMLSDPTMVNMMRNYMSGSFNDERNMDAIIEAGQRMAQFICQDHPRFLSELRQRMSNGGSRSNLDTQTNETAMDEDSQTDSNSTGSTKKNNQTNPP